MSPSPSLLSLTQTIGSRLVRPTPYGLFFFLSSVERHLGFPISRIFAVVDVAFALALLPDPDERKSVHVVELQQGEGRRAHMAPLSREDEQIERR
jgi:hypothetical protein